ncbi:hypothetical protein [Bacillus sp. MRMR6]|uniref:hypothetical protein n=1 Tax=Bacillus sp. MRMR6 TaxID=1928617 RepID=UPI00095167E5|nr:hypothetical protein [Bacillus sp. MRMR6]OLS41096.1 hypothetical protein BTR25_04305 [Bacillus sp. MRMR6]
MTIKNNNIVITDNNLILRTFLFFIGLVEFIFIALRPVPREGLDLLFLLPLTFAACVLIFGKIIIFHKGGIGLKVFYTIIIIRYLISPFFISITEGYRNIHMVDVTAASNYLATLIICVELIIACIVINFFWERYVNKAKLQVNVRGNNFKWLSLGGILLCTFLILIIALRSNRFIPTMGIFFLKEPTIDLGSYEALVVKCLTAFFFVNSLIWARKNISKSLYPLVVVYFFAFLNIGIYFGSNRSFVVQTILATVLIYLYVFPKQKKAILVFLAPMSIYIILDMYFKKQFGVDIANTNGFDISLKEISNIIENYTNGIWPMASILDASYSMRSSISVLTPIKDFVESFYPFRIPGLIWIRDLFNPINSTTDIYLSYLYPWSPGAMITLSGQMWIYGGPVFGWLFAILGNVMMVFLLVRMETMSQIVEDVKYKYMYVFMSVVMGLIMCYCLITIVWSWSKFVLFYFLILKMNDYIVGKKKDI